MHLLPLSETLERLRPKLCLSCGGEGTKTRPCGRSCEWCMWMSHESNTGISSISTSSTSTSTSTSTTSTGMATTTTNSTRPEKPQIIVKYLPEAEVNPNTMMKFRVPTPRPPPRAKPSKNRVSSGCRSICHDQETFAGAVALQLDSTQRHNHRVGTWDQLGASRGTPHNQTEGI